MAKIVHHLTTPVPLPDGRPLHAVALRKVREDDEAFIRAIVECPEREAQSHIQALTERLAGLPVGVVRLAESEDLCAIYDMVGEHCREHLRSHGKA